MSYDLQEKQSSFPPNDRWGCHLRAICNTMDTHNIDICPIERYGYALKSVRDISRICEEEMRESNHMRDITHLYPNERDGVSNSRPLDYLLNRLFRQSFDSGGYP